MWRHVVPGLAVAALALSGCHECDEYSYNCVWKFAPYYGYYQDCYAVPNECWNHRHCEGGNCQGSGTACTYSSDCSSGEVCNSGKCVLPKSTGGASGGSAGAEEDGSVTGTGAVSVDSGTSEPGDDAGPSGSEGGAGTTYGAGGSSSAGHMNTGGTSVTGHMSGSGGHSTGAGGSTGAGESTGTGASSSGAGGKGPSGGSSGSTSAGGATGTGASGNAAGGSSSSNGGRVHRFDFACVRDTQCGAGECDSGICYLACESDADCGTADRCSVETGRRLCMPDPNPPVRCDESAICSPAQTCVNGACHDPCNADTDCVNLEDRCTSHLCFPDRRPIAECVLNVECAAGLVCLDARCVQLGGQ